MQPNEKQEKMIAKKPVSRHEKPVQQSNCDTCINYVYDDDYECYCCEMNLDEDEMAKFLADSFRDCPYYQLDNEYLIVRHQM